MKNIIIIAVIVLFAACNSTETKKADEQKQKKAEQEMLLGQIQVNDLKAKPYNEWFTKEQAEYSIDSATINELHLSDYKVLVIFGTWCGDSRREVPRFIKLMKYKNFTNFTLCAVDRSKTCKTKDFGEIKVEKVPTFIFYNDSTEVGRIIESPQKSLEKDMYSILNPKM